MQIISRSKTIAFFIALSSLLVAVAVALNITWILHWRGAVQLVVGIILSALIIAGLILNTIFLVREIRRNEQQDSFVNAVTHELRTPIASIRLYLETLQSREVTEEKRQDFYRIMHKDTDRLMSSVDQVLRAAETVQKRRKQHWTAVDMGTLVEECVAAARERHHLAADALSTNAAAQRAGQVTVTGDVDELRVAISNLFDNAVKYSPQGVRIGVELLPLANEVQLRVMDQGIGIPPADLKRIFKRFYRAAWVRTRIKGTGLGLFIVRAIVVKHGGSVTADSPGEDKGTTITVRLPARQS